MTNREKYNDELMAIWEKGHQFAIEKETNSLIRCSTSGIECRDCAFHFNRNCTFKRAEWLKAEYIEPVKTVKASELPIDTIVWCADECKTEEKSIRKFACVVKGQLYAFAHIHRECTDLIHWNYMWLKDGTVILPE